MPAINKMTRSVDESSYSPKMMSEKQKKSGKAFAEKIANKMGYDLVPKDTRAKMAMPKTVDSSNFPKMAQEMAKAMDYNSSKPKMAYGDKPKMAHGDKPMMGHKPKFYGKKKKKK